jgi:FKBP-type peptidyl-prolyl cis-trans isomerase
VCSHPISYAWTACAAASGVKYTDKVFGGGEAVAPGLLVGVGYVMKVDGAVVLDTTKRPQVFLFGQRKGFAGGLCAGTEEVLRSMRQGGRRVITVPPEMAFGDRGTTLPQVNPTPPPDAHNHAAPVYRVAWAD